MIYLGLMEKVASEPEGVPGMEKGCTGVPGS